MKRLTSRLNTIDWYLAAALLLAWAAALPLLEPHALLNTRGGGDSPFLLQRTHQLLAALGQGQFPVRWMPDGYYGYGYPFFNFYAPLSIYISAGFKLLGFSYTRAIQLAQVAGFLLAAWGMYALSLRITARRAAAFIASAAYTFAPFHMVNVYVRGDSLAEFWAMAFYPLTLLSAEILLKAETRPSRVRASLLLALTFACLVLSHNISALIFSPFLLLFCLLRLPSGNVKVTANLAWLAASALLGVGLSAWFWVPALAEQGLVQLAAVTEGFFNYAAHFRGVDIVQRAGAFSYSVTGSENPFRMGLLQALLIVGSLVVVVFGWRRGSAETKTFTLFAIVVTSVATVMITPFSRAIWDTLPLLSFTQFPWRFLSAQAMGGSLLIGIAALPLLDWVAQKNRVLPLLFTTVLAGVISWSALADLQTDFIYITDADVTAQQLIEYEWFTGNVGTTISAEYLPIGVQPRAWADGVPAGTRADLWWPGTRVDRESAIAASGSGLVVGEGIVRQGRTPVEFSAEIISLLFVLVTVTLARQYRNWSVHKLLYPVGLLLLLLIGARLSQSQPIWADSQLDTRSWDLGQKAYLHHAPEGIHFSDDTILHGYEYVMVEGGVEITLHFESPGNALTLDLVSPAVYRDTDRQPAPVYATHAELIAAGESMIVVEFSAESLPPTRLLPRVRLTHASALTDAGLARGDLFLAPIVFENIPARKAVERLQVDVTDVSTLADGDSQVAVEWSTPQPLPTNYQAAWKLYDRFGRFYAEVDAQPGYGYLPSATWQPDTAIKDHVRLRWLADDGIPPFTLVATLRDIAADETVYQEQVALLDAGGLLLSQDAGRLDRLPDGAVQVEAEFASEIALRGLQIERHDSLQALVLYWEALTPELDDYVRFVHVIDPAGGGIVAQVDSQPQYNTHPTTRWQPGKLIEDVVALDIRSLPASSYELRVGLYQRSDGARLGVISAEMPITDDALHLPLTVTP